VLVVGVSPRDRAQAALARYYNASRLIFEGYSHGSILISRFHFPVTKRIAAWLEAGFSRGVEELHRRGDKAIEHDKRRRMKLYYFTGWKEPKIHLCDRRGNELSQLAMTRYRPGRFSGEALFEADVPLGEGEKFFLTGGSMEDRPYRGGYYEPAGRRLYLMDGEFFPRLPGKFRKAPTYLVREFPSRKLAHTFRINIMLPRNYGKGEHGPYPVAVLNDGQNQWKNQGAYGGWHTDAIAHDKARRGRCRELVLVSIVSHPRRDQSYLPPPMGRADLYVDFLADRLLPALRKEFALSEQPGEIALIGASYAANCALYAGLKRPDVFGLVGSLSYGRTPNDPVMRRMDALRALPIRRLYIDCGTRWAYDQPHKDDHTDTTRELILLARAKGMTPGKDLLGVIAEGHFHNEFFWRKRIGRCLEFLFPLV
jgi:predicted alpha/beta superfamily hydrolase